MKKELPEIILLNHPFKPGFIGLTEELEKCCRALEKNGVSKGVLVCNTLHLELAKLKNQIDFFKINECVMEEILEKKGKRILLLATKNTCNSELYKIKGVDFLKPSKKEQAVVNQTIDHVLRGSFSRKDSLLIEALIDSYSGKIDGALLGCTDLPVLHHHFPIRTKKVIYDSVKIPVKTILRSL
jgi:aspartate/glutamate racemase